jgi:bifunctional DNA-binding transcriptional regulator/antitoxin component of YhaV-PrlF toxin-antitoxin module
MDVGGLRLLYRSRPRGGIATVTETSLTEPLIHGSIGLMAKVTGKLQITLPKALADRCGIRVGDELDLRAAGRSIQIDKRHDREAAQVRRDRLAHFDQATARQRHRQRRSRGSAPAARGWTRDELYDRARTR